MKLWVLLDEKISMSLIKKNDIVLTTECNVSYPTDCVYVYDSFFCGDDWSIADAENELFLNLPQEWEIMKNSCHFSLFRPIVSIIRQIETIIASNGVDEIALVGGSNTPFLSLTNAEGEGNKSFYRSSWLFIPFINEHFKKTNTIKITRHKKKFDLSLITFNSIRETILLLRNVIAEVKRHSNTCNDQRVVLRGRPVAIVPVQLNLQIRHMVQLLNKQSSVDVIYIVPSYIKKDNTFKSNFITIFGCSFSESMRVLRQIIFCRTSKKKLIFCCGDILLTFSAKAFKRAISPNMFRVWCYNNVLDRVVDSIGNCKFVLTDHTYGAFPETIHNIAKKHHLLHYNFQYVVMNKEAIPNVDLADRYYISNKETYSYYHSRNNNFLLYMPIEVEKRKLLRIDNELVVSVFLQPETYASRYYNFLEEFLHSVERLQPQIRLIIKPHYRQNKGELFINLKKKYPFCILADAQDSVAEILDMSHIMMSMTSSVLFEAVSRDVPGLIIDIDGLDTRIIDSNNSCVKEVNLRIKTMDELINIMRLPDEMIEKYEKRRDDYLEGFDLSSISNEVFE